MNAQMYMKTHTKERLELICDIAGTKLSWFSLCARGHGVFSMDVAIDLEAASRILAQMSDDYMTVDELFDIPARVKQREAELRESMILADQVASNAK